MQHMMGTIITPRLERALCSVSGVIKQNQRCSSALAYTCCCHSQHTLASTPYPRNRNNTLGQADLGVEGCSTLPAHMQSTTPLSPLRPLCSPVCCMHGSLPLGALAVLSRQTDRFNLASNSARAMLHVTGALEQQGHKLHRALKAPAYL